MRRPAPASSASTSTARARPRPSPPLEDRGLAVAGDVGEERGVAAAFSEAIRAFGGVDIVVSNAGIASSAAIAETTLADWERSHRVLGTGYFLVSRAAFGVLTAQGIGGSIVFVASKNGLVAGRNAAAYSTAKAAELHLARCLAEEGGPAGIRVNAVNPDVSVFAADVAEAVLHFASRSRSAKTTGNMLNVDGGVAGAYPR